ncbi:MAG: NUDIX domain-containing protein [Myxococcales bacterium]|nr:NUDIX domain-containing protein [Myxococcales bacterium]MCB9715832.1 NUDIX domain-containing protein [Myxococcales bacterium]
MTDRHHGVVAIVTNPERTRFFVQRKDEHYRPHPRGYSLFGGAREAHEEPAQTLARELREELGAAAQGLLDAGPRHVLTIPALTPGTLVSLYEVVVDDRELDALGRATVYEGERGVVLERAELAGTPFVWGLGSLIATYLERHEATRHQP